MSALSQIISISPSTVGVPYTALTVLGTAGSSAETATAASDITKNAAMTIGMILFIFQTFLKLFAVFLETCF